MSKKRIVVLGSNFAGFTAAVSLKSQVGSLHDVTVISRLAQFVFHPSLVRLPLGARTAQQAHFPVHGLLAEHGIAFRNEAAIRLDLEGRKVITATAEERYDFLVIATGARPNYAAVPGLGPRGYTHSIVTLPEAELARDAFEDFVRAPGPVVIGDVQGSPCRALGYEFLLNLALALDRRGLSKAVALTHLTSGPPIAAGPFEVIAHAAVAEIGPGQIALADGRRLPFAFSMLLPSFLGVDVVRACEKITDASGFVRINAFHQSLSFSEVFAAGDAASAQPLERSGYLAEQSAQAVARNIAACLRGQPMEPIPALPATAGGWLDSESEAAWAKHAFERYFPAA